jgi:hypothetical protein
MLAETCLDCQVRGPLHAMRMGPCQALHGVRAHTPSLPPRPQVPLMKDPASGDRLCVNCDRSYPDGMDLDACMAADEVEAEEGEEAEVEEGGGAALGAGGSAADDIPDFSTNPVSVADAAAGGAASPSPPPVAGASMRGVHQSGRLAPNGGDRACELLSAKMLQGWALLETMCPRCTTPLVRNREKRMRCVLCDAWVVTEADAPATLTAAPPRALTPAAGPVRGRGESLRPGLNAAAATFEARDAAVTAQAQQEPAWPRAYQALPAAAAAAPGEGKAEAPAAAAGAGRPALGPPHELLSALSSALKVNQFMDLTYYHRVQQKTSMFTC